MAPHNYIEQQLSFKHMLPRLGNATNNTSYKPLQKYICDL